jgi:hypothetical protein
MVGGSYVIGERLRVGRVVGLVVGAEVDDAIRLPERLEDIAAACEIGNPRRAQGLGRPNAIQAEDAMSVRQQRADDVLAKFPATTRHHDLHADLHAIAEPYPHTAVSSVSQERLRLMRRWKATATASTFCRGDTLIRHLPAQQQVGLERSQRVIPLRTRPRDARSSV